jgi:hypothetical protein
MPARKSRRFGVGGLSELRAGGTHIKLPSASRGDLKIYCAQKPGESGYMVGQKQ